jgi:succinyl-CoA synthetase beta subunit
MNIHEFQAKLILQAVGVPILPGIVCYTPGEVEAAANQLGGGVCVVKAQVHAGGRGKAGGVKVAKNPVEARLYGEKILGMTLVTPQTGEKGKKVHKVYVEAGCNIDKEFYLSFLVDRSRKSISIVASAEGGTEIEEVAEHSPEKILTLPVDYSTGLLGYHSLRVLKIFGLPFNHFKSLHILLEQLYSSFVANDLALLEVNPLVLTKEGNFVVLDAKCSVDDNALYRQTRLQSMLDYDENDPKDIRAAAFGLSYVALDGNIGCLVNGAGLAMATMDIISQYGGRPANFLDVGGGASKDTVTEAFKILLSDSSVKAILVNIFGGIMRCDVIAEGIIAAAKELGVTIPLVVRLQGTNVDLGKKLLADSGLAITPADTIDDAAAKVVKAV